MTFLVISFDHLVADVIGLVACCSRVATADEDAYPKLEEQVCCPAPEANPLYTLCRSSVKPRPGALEWLNEQGISELVLLTGDPELAKQVIGIWRSKLDNELSKALENSKICQKVSEWPSHAQVYVARADHLSGHSDNFHEVRSLSDLVKLDPPLMKVSPRTEVSRRPFSALAWRNHTPYRVVGLQGTVVHGFKRGSSSLGIPTANIDAHIGFGARKSEDEHIFPIPGVYYGWCTLDQAAVKDTVFGCVLNIGYCPQYENQDATLEVHIFNDFEQQEFYGSKLKVDVTGFIRAESKFPVFGDLIEAIQLDCESVKPLWTPYNPQDQAQQAFGSPSKELMEVTQAV